MADSVWKLNLIRDGKITQHPLYGGSSTKNEVVCFGMELVAGDEIYLSSPDANRGYTSLEKADCPSSKTEDNHIRIEEGGTYDVYLTHIGVGKDVVRILEPTEESIREKEQQAENQKKLKAYKRREKIFVFLHNFGIFLLAFIWIIPILWLVIVSFSSSKSPNINQLPWNLSYSLSNYIQLFTQQDSTNMFNTWFMNTLIVSVCSCVICTLFTVVTAFCLSRMRFKGRKALMNLSMILGLFPGVLTMTCTYMLFTYVLQINEYNLRLIIAYSAASGLGYLVAKGFFDTIPMSIDEAARIDGANKLQTFTRIILPLSKPTIVYTIITSFMSPWVDFMYARIILPSDRTTYTVAVGLYTLLDRSLVSQYFGVFCAGSVIISIPLSILFLFVQKYYVAGVTGGAVKG